MTKKLLFEIKQTLKLKKKVKDSPVICNDNKSIGFYYEIYEAFKNGVDFNYYFDISIQLLKKWKKRYNFVDESNIQHGTDPESCLLFGTLYELFTLLKKLDVDEARLYRTNGYGVAVFEFTFQTKTMYAFIGPYVPEEILEEEFKPDYKIKFYKKTKSLLEL